MTAVLTGQSGSGGFEHVSFEDGFAVFAPVGELDFRMGTATVTRLIDYCRENKIAGVLVDVIGVVGMPNPTVTQKYWYTQEWSKAAEGKVMVALVVPGSIMDPTKIGVTMAENAGLRSDVFDNRDEAVAWLRLNIDKRA